MTQIFLAADTGWSDYDQSFTMDRTGGMTAAAKAGATTAMLMTGEWWHENAYRWRTQPKPGLRRTLARRMAATRKYTSRANSEKCMHIHIHAHPRARTSTCTHIHVTHIHTHAHTRTSTYTCTHIHMHTRTRARAYTDPPTHTPLSFPMLELISWLAGCLHRSQILNRRIPVIDLHLIFFLGERVGWQIHSHWHKQHTRPVGAMQ